MLLSKKQKNLALSTGEGQMDRTEANVEAKKYLINGMKKRMKLRRKRRKMEFGKRKDLIQTIIFSKKLMKKQSWNL